MEIERDGRIIERGEAWMVSPPYMEVQGVCVLVMCDHYDQVIPAIIRAAAHVAREPNEREGSRSDGWVHPLAYDAATQSYLVRCGAAWCLEHGIDLSRLQATGAPERVTTTADLWCSAEVGRFEVDRYGTDEEETNV